MDRRRVARVAVTPEEIGLCGCWQVVAVERKSINLSQPEAAPTLETGYYASSLTVAQHDTDEVGVIVRDHWSAIENGTHYRRDVTLGEDACRVRHRQGAEALASLRNLAIGLYELEVVRERTEAPSLKSWCQQQTFSTAWEILTR